MDKNLRKEQTERAMRELEAEFRRLFDNNESVCGKWKGTMSDLVEFTHIVWTNGDIRDECGRTLSFKLMLQKACDALGMSVPKNPTAIMNNVKRRKNIYQKPLEERVRYQIFEMKVEHPMRKMIEPAAKQA